MSLGPGGGVGGLSSTAVGAMGGGPPVTGNEPPPGITSEPMVDQPQQATWLQQLGEGIAEMGYDDFEDLIGKAFQGMGGGGEGGGMGGGYPPMTPPNQLGPVGRAGSEFFHSLRGRGGSYGSGGLF